MVTAILTHLLRHGASSDMLGALTHDDDRGTLPPNALLNAVKFALAQPRLYT